MLKANEMCTPDKPCAMCLRFRLRVRLQQARIRRLTAPDADFADAVRAELDNYEALQSAVIRDKEG